MSKKRLVVDGQVFQTTAKDRGMGRFAVCLLQALLKQSDRSMDIVFSQHLPMTTQDEKVLRQLFPHATFHKLNLWTTTKHTIERARDHNTEELTTFVDALSPQQVEFFIPSLFQEPVVAVFPARAHAKAILFHDLIPYLYQARYQQVMLYENYLKRFRTIFEADLIFTNSQTVADDLTIYLGVPKRKLCRIDGAAIHVDRTIEKPTLDFNGPFILLNTSDDPRKNNLRAVLGFEEFRATTSSDYKLVLTSTIHPREQERLKLCSKNLVFTGNMPERQLNWLYANCEALLFVPESEGLGLPVLEAVDDNKKVICSSISVLQEISPSLEAFFYCDHESSYSIARALERAMIPNVQVNTKAYAEIKRYYTWDKSAKRMLKGLDGFTPRREESSPKKHIAIFTATPSGLSGVGLTVSVLHPVLAEYFDIDYYIESGLSGASIRPDYLQYVAPCYPAHTFSVERYAGYDAVVYHMGNGDYHMESAKNSLYLPGYVIVHDTNLRELYRVLCENDMMSPERMLLEESLDATDKTQKSSYYTSIANRQLGLLTHSTYATEAMREVLKVPVPIAQTGLPTNVPENNTLRSTDKITIGLAGAIADVKGLDIIEAIAEDAHFAGCNIRLFGFNHAAPEKLAKLEAHENVSIATNVSDYDFQTSFAKLDIFVNYRMIYKGETSNTTLEAMRQGVVAIVRNIGWFSELADDVVVKVNSPEQVIDELRTLVSDTNKLRAIGARAKAYTARTFTQEKYAETLVGLLGADQSKNPNAHIAAALKAGSVRTPKQLLDLVKKERNDE
jgi:glycosyltransferase involved in cell wall biosynthesis